MTSSPAAEQAAESLLSQLTSKLVVPGIQYVVVGPDGVKFSSCSGTTDVSTSIPVTQSTTFMASSVTKTLTAAAVLQLNERGDLDIGSSLNDHYASHPYGSAVTITQLLNQTSGVPNPMPLRWLHLAEENADYDEDAALQDVLSNNSKLRSAPGSSYGYSNLAYWLLGKVIEQASGLSYSEYMRANIFDPLDIPREEMGCLISAPDLHACGHLKQRSILGVLMPLMMNRDVFLDSSHGRKRFKPLYMNGPAYGGLIGTAHAFARFLQDQLRPESVLFDKTTKASFFSEQRDSKGHLIETTLGWHRGELSGTTYYGKPGGGPGFQSNMRIYPAMGIGTVWLANETAANEGPIHSLTDKLDRHFLKD